LHQPPAAFLTAAAALFPDLTWETNLTVPILRDEPTAPPGWLTSHDLHWTDDPGSWNRPVVYATNVASRAVRKRFTLTNYTTLQVETMPIKTTGSATAGGWNLFANGYVAQDITVPQSGSFLFGVLARGTPALGAWPRLSLRIDGVFRDAVSVTSSTWSLFPYAPPEDRNLLLDLVRFGPDTTTSRARILTRPGVLAEMAFGNGLIILDEVNWENPGKHGVKAERLLSSLLTSHGAAVQSAIGLSLEAEEMTPVGVNAGATNNGVVWLYSSGRLQTQVRFTDAGNYRFEITGQGTPALGVYPVVELRIDGIARGTVEIATGSPTSFSLSTNITAGTHTVALAFINDLYAPPDDRNLGLDRLIIQPVQRPEILDLRFSTNRTTAALAWSASPGSVYDIESRPGIASGSWSTLGSTNAAGTVTSWIDDGTAAGAPPASPARPQAFYRVNSLQP